MAGGVDDVEAELRILGIAGIFAGRRAAVVGAEPETGRRSRRNGDPALLLLLHPVHGGVAVMNFADLVGPSGVVEDALGCRCLAGIDVGHDAEVAVTLECIVT